MFARKLDSEVLENKTVDGNSVVGNVNSNEGQLKFSNSNGNGNGNDGVGFSVRQRITTIRPSLRAVLFYWVDLRQPPSILPISTTLACSWCKVVSLASF